MNIYQDPQTKKGSIHYVIREITDTHSHEIRLMVELHNEESFEVWQIINLDAIKKNGIKGFMKILSYMFIDEYVQLCKEREDKKKRKKNRNGLKLQTACIAAE